MAAAKRNESESFKQYRARLGVQAQADKAVREGQLIWDSRRRGSYIEEKHGKIGRESA